MPLSTQQMNDLLELKNHHSKHLLTASFENLSLKEQLQQLKDKCMMEVQEKTRLHEVIERLESIHTNIVEKAQKKVLVILCYSI